jgi:hypothetical protein
MPMTATDSIYALLERGLDPIQDWEAFPEEDYDARWERESDGMTPKPKELAAALQLLRSGELDAADLALSKLLAEAHLRGLVDSLPQLREVAAPARELLARTRDYETARWAILLGYLASAIDTGLTDDEVERVSLLAHHEKLTPPVLFVLDQAAAVRPQRHRDILALGPWLHDLSLLALINRRDREPTLHGDPTIDRQLLIDVCAGDLAEGPELASALARVVGLEPLVAQLDASGDERFRSAGAWLFTTLLTAGTLDEQLDGDRALASWADATVARPDLLVEERTALAYAARWARGRSDLARAEQWRDAALRGMTIQSVIDGASDEAAETFDLLVALDPPEARVAALEHLHRDPSPEGWGLMYLAECHDSEAVQSALLDWLAQAPGITPVPAAERLEEYASDGDDESVANYILDQVKDAPPSSLRPLLARALQARYQSPRSTAIEMLLARPELVDDTLDPLLREQTGLLERPDALLALARAGRLDKRERRRYARELEEAEARAEV